MNRLNLLSIVLMLAIVVTTTQSPVHDLQHIPLGAVVQFTDQSYLKASADEHLAAELEELCDGCMMFSHLGAYNTTTVASGPLLSSTVFSPEQNYLRSKDLLAYLSRAPPYFT